MTNNDRNPPAGDSSSEIAPDHNRPDRQADLIEPEERPNDPEDSPTREDQVEILDEAESPQDDQSRLQAITDEYRGLDKQGIAGKARQGELLERARRIFGNEKSWVKYVTGPLATNMMDAHRKLRIFEASKRVGLNELLNSGLSESAIWHLAAPDVPDEALWEAMEQSKTAPITAAQAERIALDSMRARNPSPKSAKPTKPRPEKIPLEPTPEAIARYVIENFTDEETDRLCERVYAPPVEKNDTRINTTPISRAVNWVRHAKAKKIASGQSPGLGAYLIKDGWIYASDGKIIAAALFPHEGPFVVPAPAFRQAVLDEPEIEIGVDEIVTTHRDGSTRRIPTLPLDQFPETQEPTGDRHPLKWDARIAIRKLAPFGSHDTGRPEAMGIKLEKRKAFVVNGRTKVQAKRISLEIRLFLSIALVDFISNQRADPIELVLGDSWTWCVWSDGSYAGIQQVKLDDSAEDVLKTSMAELKTVGTPTFNITEDWRAAVQAIRRSGAEEVEIYEDRLVGNFKSGSSGTGDHSCEVKFPIETPIPGGLEGKCLKVPLRQIDPVLQVANAIDFTVHPNPIPFAGENIAGLFQLPTSPRV